MIRSMTGFGRADLQVGSVRLQLELRSVNHRHLDVSVRLPRAMAVHEQALRSCLQGRFARGKVELSLVPGAAGAGEAEPVVDRTAAARYVEAARELADQHGLDASLPVARLLQLPGVARLREPELPDEALGPALREAALRAADHVAAMRDAEGRALLADLLRRLETVEGLASSLEARAETVARAVRERLDKRAQQLARELGSVDPARVAQEVVHAADRMDVTEEIVRLRSHVEQFRAALRDEGGEPVGRRLDFLLQELLREANTIGSKGSDAPIAHAVVELKTELERIREQVQNVE